MVKRGPPPAPPITRPANMPPQPTQARFEVTFVRESEEAELGVRIRQFTITAVKREGLVPDHNRKHPRRVRHAELVVCHVVRHLGAPLSDFPSHECAQLLADVFCASKAHVRNAYLTLLGTDGMGFAITPKKLGPRQGQLEGQLACVHLFWNQIEFERICYSCVLRCVRGW